MNNNNNIINLFNKKTFADLPKSKLDISDTAFANGKTEDPEIKTVIEDSSKDVSDAHEQFGPSSNKYISILPEDMINRVRDSINSKSRELFSECQEEVKKFLSEEPYTEFRRSMYFHRYLQWKYLESQPVTYKTFRMYRVLGKRIFNFQVSLNFICTLLNLFEVF